MRYQRYPRETGYGYDRRREPDDFTRDYGSGRDYTYSSARDYAAAGYDQPGHDHEEGGYGDRGGRYRDEGYGGDWRGSYASDGHRFADYGRRWRGRDQGAPRGRRDEDRGFFERAGDEIRSWFGDEEAERRRERDARARDADYYEWRRSQIADLDRDYDEYRRENAQRFESEFGSWRSERQNQRSSLRRVTEHMEVLGSDGGHVGTVDCVRGDRIVLTKSDADAGGRHHSIPSRWIQSVDDKVTIRKTADEAKAHWRDEERSGAFGWDRDDDREGGHILNRSFSGTY